MSNKIFLSDKPCKRGHTPTFRNISRGNCVECIRENSKKWHEHNRPPQLIKSAEKLTQNIPVAVKSTCDIQTKNESDETGVIFLAVCSVNGKSYVGKTTRVSLFMSGGYIGSGGIHYKRAKVKYGRDAFHVALLERVIGKRQYIDIAERKWIYFYRSILGDNMYNETEGGEGITVEGMKLRLANPEFAQKWKEGAKNAWIGKDERRAEMSARTSARNTRTYRLISPNKEIFTFTNLRNFCIEHKLDYFSMRFVCQGRIFRRNGPYVGWISLDHYPEKYEIAA